jgi:PBP1b-binding outer membrane lipoprotein LpoB
MLSRIHKIKIIICVSILSLLISNCNSKSDLKDKITITINSIDKETKQRRVNMFDTVIVRRESIGYLKKTFDKVGEYVTDSTGSIKIKIDSSKVYDISVSGLNVLGGDMYYPESLKNGQEVNIEVFPIGDR